MRRKMGRRKREEAARRRGGRIGGRER